MHLRGRVITVLCVVRGRDIVFASKRVTSAERVAGVSQWCQWTARIFLYPPIPKKFFGLSPDPFKKPFMQLAFYAFFSKTRVFAHSFLDTCTFDKIFFALNRYYCKQKQNKNICGSNTGRTPRSDRISFISQQKKLF